jgi:hypothetical protein
VPLLTATGGLSEDRLGVHSHTKIMNTLGAAYAGMLKVEMPFQAEFGTASECAPCAHVIRPAILFGSQK